jgi:hypothetical protein
MEYSFMFFVSQPELSFSKIKDIIRSYELGELHFVQCVTHYNGIRQIFFHYKKFTNHYLRTILDEYDLTHENPPSIQYDKVNGRSKSWYVCKTMTPNERTTVHFRPIQRISSKMNVKA